MKKPITNEEIGDLVRAARIARGMTQPALAKKIGLTFQMVQKYEKGQSAMTVPRLAQMARALGMRAIDLLPKRAR